MFFNLSSLLAILLSLSVLNIGGSCKPAENGSAERFLIDSNYVFPYNLQEPDTLFQLPDILVEISGLTVFPGTGYLAAVQDEEGIVFQLDTRTGEIISKIPFKDAGDYEGIELTEAGLFVMDSDGDLFHIEDWQNQDRMVTKHETELTKESDTEGLGYDKKTNRLLIACKGKAPGTSDEKAIFAFDLEEKKLDTIPVFKIDLQTVRNYLDSGKSIAYLDKIEEFIHPSEGGFTFAPSAIAVHPVSGEFYILSSVGRILMVTSPEGKILYMEKLKKKLYSQPEGICFDSKGTLWISNEGKKGSATLLRFDMK